ncbi:MAG: prepilin-type N-terminal cleavage/methylation domain-containing protein [Candidatus Electrothrix sp. GM3_4]|nr:prepilin-type N-terminal cleavage/methylation domain-containing protein [Candidatus Electrothrix sp. GM3_4]
MKLNKLRIQANEKGFTLIELMIVIAIIGILAAVAIPNFIEYKNKSYCTATVNDVGAIGGALADYFSNPANTTASTGYILGANGTRPSITVGTNMAGDASNTLLLSASTTPGISGMTEAAGAIRVGPNYAIYAVEGAGNCPTKITESDSHWIAPSSVTEGVGGGIAPVAREATPSAVVFFKTL